MIGASEEQRESFLSVYQHSFMNIFWVSYSSFIGAEEANEIAQEAFARKWELLAEGEEIENVTAMVHSIASNLLKDEVHKRRKRRHIVSRFKPLDNSASYDDRSCLLDINKMLDLLDKMDLRYRQVLTLRYIEELDIKTTAKRLGLGVNVVKVRAHRGIKQLRKLLVDSLQ